MTLLNRVRRCTQPDNCKHLCCHAYCLHYISRLHAWVPTPVVLIDTCEVRNK